jgi:phosphonate transport system substrate-binding protein
MLRRTFCALVIAASFASAHAADEDKTLNFGIISTESSANLRSGWQPVIDDMSRTLGVPVKPFFASDYAGVIEAMRFNKVQIAWYGNKAAIEAVDRSKGEVFASVVDKEGNAGYWSVLLVNKHNPKLKTLDDVLKNGKTLNYGMGDPNSTSGSAVPGFYLFGANHIDPRTFFKTARVANHETNLMSVINKQTDVAIANTEALAHYQINTGKDPLQDVTIVWKSPLIASDPLVWRTDLSPELKTKIRDFFVNYGKGANSKQELANLAALNYKAFNPSTNAQLIPIRQMDLAGAKAKLEADGTISAADKTKQIAEIDSKLAALAQPTAKN